MQTKPRAGSMQLSAARAPVRWAVSDRRKLNPPRPCSVPETSTRPQVGSSGAGALPNQDAAPPRRGLEPAGPSRLLGAVKGTNWGTAAPSRPDFVLRIGLR